MGHVLIREYAPISEMRLIMHEYGNEVNFISNNYGYFQVVKHGIMCAKIEYLKNPLIQYCDNKTIYHTNVQ